MSRLFFLEQKGLLTFLEKMISQIQWFLCAGIMLAVHSGFKYMNSSHGGIEQKWMVTSMNGKKKIQECCCEGD